MLGKLGPVQNHLCILSNNEGHRPTGLVINADKPAGRWNLFICVFTKLTSRSSLWHQTTYILLIEGIEHNDSYASVILVYVVMYVHVIGYYFCLQRHKRNLFVINFREPDGTNTSYLVYITILYVL